MRPDNQAKADHCACCKVCTNCPGFQKVLAVPDAGYVLYRHTTTVDDINKETGALEKTVHTVDDVFILEKTQGEYLGKIDVTPEIDRNKIKCSRCVNILKNAQKLIGNQDIGKSGVMGICQHCKNFGSTCVKCEDAVKKFHSSKRTQREIHSQKVKTWLSKIQKIIKLSLFSDKKGKQMTRGNSDVDLNNLLRKIKAGREPEIEDLFLHGIRELYASKRGPGSEDPYFLKSKDKDIVFEEPQTDEDKQQEYIEMRKDFFEDDSFIPSIVTLTEDDLEKDFIRTFGKSYKGNLKYTSPAESKGFDQDDARRQSEEKSKVSTRYIDTTGKLSDAKGYEYDTTKKDLGKSYTIDAPYERDSRKVKKKLPIAKDSGKKLERKLSSSAQVIYESPSRIRKYRSAESLLTGMTKMNDDMQKQESFDYYFPESIKGRKKLKVARDVSSSELIKETLNKLKSKIELEGKKRAEAERIKEERRKRLEKERKEREARIIAQQMAKAVEKMPNEQDVLSMRQGLKAKKIEISKIKNKELQDPKKKEKPLASTKSEKPKKKKVSLKDENSKPEINKNEKLDSAKDKKEEKNTEEKPLDENDKDEKSKEYNKKRGEKDQRSRMELNLSDKEKQMQELKLQREEENKAKMEQKAKAQQEVEKKKLLMLATKPKQKLEVTKIKMKRPSFFGLIQELNIKIPASPGDVTIPTKIEYKRHMCKHGKKETDCDMCRDSDYDLDVQNILWKREDDEVKKNTIKEAVVGDNIYRYKTKFGEEEAKDLLPTSLFQRNYEDSYGPAETVGPETCGVLKSETDKILQKSDPEYGKGIIKYSLSDRTFIDKGWTKLPTEKVVRKMNVYRMRPAHPEFDWFEHNKKKGQLQYDTGEKLAEIDENGRGRWFYRSGLLALDYYNAEEMNAQHRYVVYSSGEPDERGRTHPRTVLASFDYLGNGIVFDHTGKIRLKFNQTEGIILDRSLGPVSHWKWHTLNDPPVLQQVMIDTQMSHKDPNILKLGGPAENKPRVDDEAMLAIEFDNFIKDKSAKLTQTFKPFQIKMKALKINEYFSLRVLDQANVYLIYRDGKTNIKLNVGMILDHKEIVDTDTAEVGEVSSNLEHLPAKTDSLAELQRNIDNAQTVERIRFERDRRVNRPQQVLSVDCLKKAASKPMKMPLMTVDSSSGASKFCKCRKPSASNVYYGTGFV